MCSRQLTTKINAETIVRALVARISISFSRLCSYCGEVFKEFAPCEQEDHTPGEQANCFPADDLAKLSHEFMPKVMGNNTKKCVKLF